MLDIKFIRENKELVKEGAEKKGVKVDISKLLKIDDRRRELLQSVETKRAEQNSFNEKITKLSGADKEGALSEMKELKKGLQKEEGELQEVLNEWNALMLKVPNIPDMTVPEGGEGDGEEVKKWGEIQKFSFKPKSHIELMENLGMVDFERGTRVAGFRGYFLKSDGALLNFAVWQFALEHFLGKGGFTPMVAPSLVKRGALEGTGYLPEGEDDLYKTQDGDFLAGTSEVAMMSYHSGEILEQKDLPVKFFGFSDCFRREAGSHGKDTKGIMRVHEFYKFEQVVICEASHDESVKYHEWINKNTEEFIEALGIPYHTIVNAARDIGLGQVKKYDIELWVPSEEKYREISSASYFHDFQTRRLNIRYKDKDGNTKYAHSLNSTAIATPRVLIAIVENNQNEDGSINVPEALQKYLGKKIIK